MKGYYKNALQWAKKYGDKSMKVWQAAALGAASYYAGHYGYGWDWVMAAVEMAKGLWQ